MFAATPKMEFAIRMSLIAVRLFNALSLKREADYGEYHANPLSGNMS